MKKFFSFCLMAIMLALMSSCSSGPGDSFKGYMNDLKKSDYEAVAQGFYLKDKGDDAEKVNKNREQLTSLLKEKYSKQLEKKQGLDKVEITSETIAEDGNSAVVEYCMYYGDGTTEEGKQKMIKSDGKWLMDVGK